jgi:hypothetical protein
MSLTRHLADRSSPLRVWFDERFPHTRRLSADGNSYLGNGRSGCPIEPPPGSERDVVGTAVDYLVRTHLTHTALDTTVASRAGWRTPEAASKARLAERSAVAQVRALRPWNGELDLQGWATLCATCALLAKFEQCARVGLGVSLPVENALNRVDDIEDPVRLAAQMVDEATLVDLGALGRSAVVDHLDLRRSRVLHLNPTFVQSRPIGGADADLVYDGTLLDFKATASKQIIVRRVILQLLGYALADTTDAYGINAVGVSALRWRRRLIWPLGELIDELSGGTATNVASVRQEFAAVTAGLADGLPRGRG